MSSAPRERRSRSQRTNQARTDHAPPQLEQRQDRLENLTPTGNGKRTIRWQEIVLDIWTIIREQSTGGFQIRPTEVSACC